MAHTARTVIPCSLVSMEQAAKKSVTKSHIHFLMTRKATFCPALFLRCVLGRNEVLPSPPTSSQFHLIGVKIAAVRKERNGGDELLLLLLPWPLLLLHLLVEMDRMFVDWFLISCCRRRCPRLDRTAV